MTILDLLKKEIAHISYRLNYLSSSEADGLENEKFKFDVSFIDTVNSKFGDISTNISLVLAKRQGKLQKK